MFVAVNHQLTMSQMSEKTSDIDCLPDRLPRVPGFWQGQVKIADDFDETSEEIIAAFYEDEEP